MIVGVGPGARYALINKSHQSNCSSGNEYHQGNFFEVAVLPDEVGRKIKKKTLGFSKSKVFSKVFQRARFWFFFSISFLLLDLLLSTIFQQWFHWHLFKKMCKLVANYHITQKDMDRLQTRKSSFVAVLLSYSWLLTLKHATNKSEFDYVHIWPQHISMRFLKIFCSFKISCTNKRKFLSFYLNLVKKGRLRTWVSIIALYVSQLWKSIFAFYP